MIYCFDLRNAHAAEAALPLRLMGKPNRSRSRAERGHGGRTRGDAGHEHREHGSRGVDTPNTMEPEPTLAELMRRADALRRTGEALVQSMGELAAQIDAAMSQRHPAGTGLGIRRRKSRTVAPAAAVGAGRE